MVKILVAEDDEDNVDILCEFLGDAGYDVVTAANAADAVKLAEDEQPAVILMDMQMPDAADAATLNREAGLMAVRKLRADPRTRPIPIVVLTGFDARMEDAAIDSAGCDAVASKPYDFASLLGTITDLLTRE